MIYRYRFNGFWRFLFCSCWILCSAVLKRSENSIKNVIWKFRNEICFSFLVFVTISCLCSSSSVFVVYLLFFISSSSSSYFVGSFFLVIVSVWWSVREWIKWNIVYFYNHFVSHTFPTCGRRCVCDNKIQQRLNNIRIIFWSRHLYVPLNMEKCVHSRRVSVVTTV